MGTGKRPFSGVCSHMSSKVTFLAEDFVAFQAFKFVFGVREHVTLQRTLVAERLGALLTLERSYCMILSYMNIQIILVEVNIIATYIITLKHMLVIY